MTQPIRLMVRPEQVRQGDVLCVPIERVKDAWLDEKIEHGDGRVVLAFGEVTGHAHAFYPMEGNDIEPELRPDDVARWSLKDPEKHCPMLLKLQEGFPQTFDILRVEKRALLRHEEHDWINFAPGDYAIIHQYEGDEFDPALRPVYD